MAWSDILTNPPPDEAMVLARRYPEDTPDIYGQWSLAQGGLVLPHPEPPAAPVVVPWPFLTHYKQLTAPPPWPGAAHPKSWRDPYYYPPADGQSVWLRRFFGGCAAVPATYTAADACFTVVLQGTHALSAPFYCFYQWKPM